MKNIKMDWFIYGTIATLILTYFVIELNVLTIALAVSLNYVIQFIIGNDDDIEELKESDAIERVVDENLDTNVKETLKSKVDITLDDDVKENLKTDVGITLDTDVKTKVTTNTPTLEQNKKELEGKTVVQLKAILKERNITGFNKKSKADIIKKLVS